MGRAAGTPATCHSTPRSSGHWGPQGFLPFLMEAHIMLLSPARLEVLRAQIVSGLFVCVNPALTYRRDSKWSLPGWLPHLACCAVTALMGT